MDEGVTIGIDIFKEKSLKEPNMIRSGAVQPKMVLEATEKGTPTAAEVPANLHPQPLNAGVMGRAEGMTISR